MGIVHTTASLAAYVETFTKPLEEALTAATGHSPNFVLGAIADRDDFRKALVTALADVKSATENNEKLLALVAIQQDDITLTRDALATAHEDVLRVVCGGKWDLWKTASGLDVAIQALVISHATRGERLALVPQKRSVTPERK
jgi:hypothetical protein